MILKLIILIAALLGVYKLLGGKLPTLKSKEEKKIEEDTLVECEACGTFVTTKEAIIAKGTYFCSLECANKA
jgi:uncharacterized protein